jgi:iron complex outermembrane recepter protein
LRSQYGLSPVCTGNICKDTSDLIQQKWLNNIFYGYTLSLNYDLREKIKIDIGNSANQYDGDHYGKIIWAEYAKKEDIDKNWYFNTGKKREYNSFVKVHYTVSDKINLYGDIQYRKVLYSIKGDHDDLRILDQNHSFDFINPKLGIHYAMHPAHSIFFSYASSSREPGRNDYRDADKDKKPRAEKLIDYELGYKFQAKKYHLKANAYFMDYDDQLVLTGEINNVGDPIMTNIKRSYRIGIELENNIRIKEAISWYAFVSLSKNKIPDFKAYVDDFSGSKQIEEELGKTDLSFSPEIISGSSLEIKLHKNMHISLLSKYVGKQYIDNTSSKERMLHSYLVNDLMFSYSFSSEWIRETEISFIIYNLFNEKYESNAWVYRYYYEGKEYKYDGYFPQALSHYMLSLHIKF